MNDIGNENRNKQPEKNNALPTRTALKKSSSEAAPLSEEITALFSAPGKEPKKRSLFFKIYISVTASLLVIIAIGLIVFASYLREYESALPSHVATDFFNKYYATRDFDSLYELGGGTSAFDSKDSFVSYMNNLVGDNEITFYRGSAGLSDEEKFIVKAEKTKIGEFTLIPSEETTSYGFKKYKFSSVKNIYGANEAVKIKVPEGSRVYVNDILVGEEYLTGEPEETLSCQSLPEGVQGVRFVTYSIKGLLASPSVRATDNKGREIVFTDSPDNSSYIGNLNYDNDRLPEVQDRVTNAAFTYSKYTKEDADRYALKEYFITDSPFYRNVLSEMQIYNMIYRHISYNFTDVKLDNLYFYDDNNFSCHITYKHTLVVTSNYSRVYANDFDLFMTKINNKWMVYDVAINESAEIK